MPEMPWTPGRPQRQLMMMLLLPQLGTPGLPLPTQSLLRDQRLLVGIGPTEGRPRSRCN